MKFPGDKMNITHKFPVVITSRGTFNDVTFVRRDLDKIPLYTFHVFDWDDLDYSLCPVCLGQLPEDDGLCSACNFDWDREVVVTANIKDLVQKYVDRVEANSRSCQHQDHEDCLTCTDCQECREDLDEFDRCPNCGGNLEDYHKFYFKVTLSGVGTNSYAAWEDAVEAFTDDPGFEDVHFYEPLKIAL
jgi:hypothetical protein